MSSVPGSALAIARAAVAPLAAAFSGAGYRLYLVGGLIRDDLIGRVRDDVDYDLTTDARPETIKTLVDPFADAVWTCLLYTSPSPRDATLSRMPSSA